MSERIITIVFAFALDSLIGDPVFAMHPVRLLGRAASRLEKLLRPLLLKSPLKKARAEAMAGSLCWIIIACSSGLLAWLAIKMASVFGPVPRMAMGSFFVWASISAKDLALHAYRVYLALKEDQAQGRQAAPLQGRLAVSMMVGRNTERLDSSGVARACIESVAESSVDAVAAPLFWAFVLGPWAAFVYRAINTMDSMFGHKDEKYMYFGRLSARADDAANWIAARVSGFAACFLAPIAGGSIKASLKSFFAYRLAHESPNSGHPEAAYAGALGLKLGGPSFYAEGLVDKPWLNPNGQDAIPKDIKRAVLLMYAQSLLVIVLGSLLTGLLFVGKTF